MNYSLEKIRTAQACDTLLVRAQKKKQGLERKRRNLGEAIDTFRMKMEAIGPDLEVTQLTLAAFTAAAVAMPEGKDKMGLVVKIKRLELRQAVLQQRATVYHVQALLAKEVDLMMLDNQVVVMEQYIEAVEMRRAVLHQPVVAEGLTDVADVMPDPAVWRSVVNTFLNTSRITPFMAGPPRAVTKGHALTTGWLSRRETRRMTSVNPV